MTQQTKTLKMVVTQKNRRSSKTIWNSEMTIQGAQKLWKDGDGCGDTEALNTSSETETL
jgi:hypothetical protein